MLGIYRFMASNVVVFCHLWIGSPPWSQLGFSAIFMFYAMSGYLMTRVLNDTYSFSVSGLGRYAVNRALRLYPQYWLIMLLAIPLVWAFPQDAFRINPKLSMPDEVSGWLANIFIFGLLDGTTRVLIPPAWSLDIEIVFYALMGLLLSRHRHIVLIWFIGSVVFTVYMNFTDVSFAKRYASYAAASLPFSTGAMIYFYKDFCKKYLSLRPILALALLAVTAFLVRQEVFGSPLDAGFYILSASAVLVLISLSNVKAREQPVRLRKLDQFLGELAYPIFLCHWHVATLVLHFGFDGVRPDDRTLWLSSVGFVHLFGFFVYYLVDNQIHRFRDIVRGKKRQMV